MASISFWINHLAYSDINWKNTLSSIITSWEKLKDDPVKIDLDLLDRIVEIFNEDKGDEPEFSQKGLYNKSTEEKKRYAHLGILSRVPCGGVSFDYGLAGFDKLLVDVNQFLISFLFS